MVGVDPPEKTAGKVGCRVEKAMETATEVVQQTTEVVVEKLRPVVKSVSLRETLCSEGFDDTHGWRRIKALWGMITVPFCR